MLDVMLAKWAAMHRCGDRRQSGSTNGGARVLDGAFRGDAVDPFVLMNILSLSLLARDGRGRGIGTIAR